jgi:hypothetical protein
MNRKYPQTKNNKKWRIYELRTNGLPVALMNWEWGLGFLID